MLERDFKKFYDEKLKFLRKEKKNKKMKLFSLINQSIECNHFYAHYLLLFLSFSPDIEGKKRKKEKKNRIKKDFRLILWDYCGIESH